MTPMALSAYKDKVVDVVVGIMAEAVTEVAPEGPGLTTIRS